MDFQSLRDANNIKDLFVEIWRSFCAEVKKLREVNKDSFVSSFKKYFYDYLLSEYKKICEQKLDYFKFEGRATRRQFWMFFLFSFIILLIIHLGVLILPFLKVLFAFCVYILAVVTIIPNISLVVRRFHDIDLSGWWILIGFIPYISFIVFLILAIKGDAKANKYGPVVKA